ncbi:hypothetical protein LRR18_00800 [Mangrovimonas sp. AS39]|uniref:hypothetical protein n=1 Tax=Mangrovimonas futianensis TaxID=2895523 RepID=UPI001E3184F6|nr:hypothetical protein [Mangrovimonas futianensis]MCF1190105.1 hypothetical protein [Mangrovimonas futianensis]MCF1194144.1 hypothetical protein [Mangrovimonas futianensis]
MEITFTKINGSNVNLDYDLLKKSIIEKLQGTCKKVEVVILNNFPVSIYSQANIDFLLLIRIPDIHNSYYKIQTKKDFVYLHNALIAVSIVKDYKNYDLELSNSELLVDDIIIDFKDNAEKLKWALTNYLAEACKFERNKITVHPVFWVLNNKTTQVDKYLIASNNFTFDLMEQCIALNKYVKYSGYSGWNQYSLNFDNDIRNLFEQASKDSELGYLTKKKIDRIQNKFDAASQKAYDKIGEVLVEVKGKPGTGKSSDLLKWMLNLSLNGQNATFLTYNHLLVYDLAKHIRSFENTLSEEKRSLKGSTTTFTLHKFFYNLAKKLGVLTLMSAQRISELVSILDKRLIVIENYFIEKNNIEPEINIEKVKMYVQTNRDFDEGLKREALDFIRFLNTHKCRRFESSKSINGWIKKFKKLKQEQVNNLLNSQVFLEDYHKVLERILQAIGNLDGYIDDFDITNKPDLLAPVFGFERSDSLLEDLNNKKYDLNKLKSSFRRSIGGFRKGRMLFLDEAQDCHAFEKDILLSIFGYNNIIIANGDKEQLIRYSTECKWYVSQAQKVPMYTYLKKRKSFRMKPAIAHLANHIAESFGIDLGVEPLDTEDHGQIIIDKHYNGNLQSKVNAIRELYTLGARQGCTAYESILLLCPSDITKRKNNEDNLSDIDDFEAAKNIKINEFDVIKEDTSKTKEEWNLISEASKQIALFRFWNTTGNVDKRKQSVPGSLSVRSIYYESCRGIEAWSVLCYGLDHFFNNKINEDEADNFLLENVLLTPIERKNMYAATWVLMALTRAIDTCYLELEHLESPLSKAIQSFATNNPHYIKYI